MTRDGKGSGEKEFISILSRVHVVYGLGEFGGFSASGRARFCFRFAFTFAFDSHSLSLSICFHFRFQFAFTFALDSLWIRFTALCIIP